jgi:hypothetical protein
MITGPQLLVLYYSYYYYHTVQWQKLRLHIELTLSRSLALCIHLPSHGGLPLSWWCEVKPTFGESLDGVTAATTMEAIVDWNLDKTLTLSSHESNPAVSIPGREIFSLPHRKKPRLVVMFMSWCKMKNTSKANPSHSMCFPDPRWWFRSCGYKHIRHVFEKLKINRITYDQSLIQVETENKSNKIINQNSLQYCHPRRGDAIHTSQVIVLELIGYDK